MESIQKILARAADTERSKRWLFGNKTPVSLRVGGHHANDAEAVLDGLEGLLALRHATLGQLLRGQRQRA